MKKVFKKQVFVFRAFLLMSLLSSGPVFSEDKKPVDSNRVQNGAEKSTQDQMAEKRQKVNQEALSAIRETQNALKAFDEGKDKEALSALERATGKLELILVREPKLSLAPAGAWVSSQRTHADINKITELRMQAARLLNEGRVQEARHLLQNLASETVINVSNIPLITYPTAIKEAVRFADQGKIEDAKQILQTALNTLVITQTIVPLPVVEAEQLLKQAEVLSEQKDPPPDSAIQMANFLKKARTELELAQALGYGTKSDFKSLYQELSDIGKKTEAGKPRNNIFSKIKITISDLIKKVRQPFEKESVS